MSSDFGSFTGVVKYRIEQVSNDGNRAGFDERWVAPMSREGTSKLIKYKLEFENFK